MNISLTEEKSKYADLKIRYELLDQEYAEFRRDVALKNASKYGNESDDRQSKLQECRNNKSRDRAVLYESVLSNEKAEPDESMRNRDKYKRSNYRMDFDTYKKDRFGPFKGSRRITTLDKNRSSSKNRNNNNSFNIDLEDMESNDWTTINRYKGRKNVRNGRDKNWNNSMNYRKTNKPDRMQVIAI